MAKHRKNLIRLSGLRVPDVGGQHKKTDTDSRLRALDVGRQHKNLALYQ